MSERHTVAAVIADYRSRLSAAGVDDALRDARLLIGHVCSLKALDLITNPSHLVSVNELASAEKLLQRRMKGESIHRIIGHREFYNLDLEISRETLEPRPDTEVLVDALVPHLMSAENRGGTPRVLDLGTGTGAICLSLLDMCQSAIGIGVDVSEDALATSIRNAAKNGLTERYSALKSDWFDQVEGQFDIIASNPPYIRSAVIENLDVIVKAFDPPAALDGGPDGLEPYRVIAQGADAHLAPGGVIGVEIGFDQRVDVSEIFAASDYRLIESRKDYGENDRVLLFKRGSDS